MDGNCSLVRRNIRKEQNECVCICVTQNFLFNHLPISIELLKQKLVFNKCLLSEKSMTSVTDLVERYFGCLPCSGKHNVVVLSYIFAA